MLHCQDYLQQSLEEKDLSIKKLSETIAQNDTVRKIIYCVHISFSQIKQLSYQIPSNLFKDAENLKNDLNNRNVSYKNLKKEFQKSRKMIGEYQLMIRAGANGLHKV